MKTKFSLALLLAALLLTACAAKPEPAEPEWATATPAIVEPVPAPTPEIEQILETDAPIDLHNSLLLGLSDDKGRLRTLWIRQEGSKLKCDILPDEIVFQRGGELWSLRNYSDSIEWGDYETSADENDLYGGVEISKLLIAPYGENASALFSEMTAASDYGYFEIYDIPMYIGEEYICYEQQASFSSGGSYHWSTKTVRFDKLDNLANFVRRPDSDGNRGQRYLVPNFEEITLGELIYGKQFKSLIQDDFRDYNGNPSASVDLAQLAIRRNHGRWSIMIPIMSEYYHPGNGSYGYFPEKYATFSNAVPDLLAQNKDEPEGFRIWTDFLAVDYLGFPNDKIGIVQEENSIEVVIEEHDGFDTLLRVPTGINERIVSIHRLNGDSRISS